jgi:hypothetical protein
MEDPASPSYFAKHKIMSLDTKPSRIEPGVSQIRGLLWNPMTQTADFAILDDSQMDNKNIMLVEAMEHWTHRKTPLGFDMTKFEENSDWDHPIDALRYALTPFQEDLRISTDVKVGPPEIRLEVAAAAGNSEAMKIIKEKNEMANQMAEHLRDQFGLENVFVDPKNFPTQVLKPQQNPIIAQEEEAHKKPSGKGGIRFKF